MRPNIDLPWSIHGDVKEHAEQTGQSIEEAYIDIIKRGLKATGDRSGQFHLDETGDVHFSPISEDTGVGTVALFSNFSGGTYDDPTVIRAEERNLEMSEVEGILTTLHRLFPLDNGSFGIHQRNGGWYGEGGIGQFTYWLDNLEELYQNSPDNFDIDRHRTASAAFLGWTAFPARHVLVYATPNGHGTVEKFGIEFLVDGYPIEGGKFRQFADEVGLSLTHAQSWREMYDYDHVTKLEKANVHPEGPVVLEQELYDSDDAEVVDGALCRNPFYGEEGRAEETFETAIHQATLPEIEYLYGSLKHSVDKDMNYDLFVSRFGVTNLQFVTSAPFNLISINLEINW